MCMGQCYVLGLAHSSCITGSGARSMTVSSILKREGFKALYKLLVGMDARVIHGDL